MAGHKVIDRRTVAMDSESVAARLAQQKQKKTAPAASAPAAEQKTTGGSYYAPREYGTQTAALGARVETARTAMEEQAAELDRSRAGVANLYKDAQQKQTRYEQTKGKFRGADAAALEQQMKDEWSASVRAYADGYRQLQAQIEAYRPYEEQYNAAVTAYNGYLEQEQAAYDDWRGTVRDAETIRAEQAQVSQLRRELERRMKQGNYTADGSGPIPTQEAALSNEQRIAELQAYLGAVGQREKLLEEELGWSERFYYEDMKANADFAQLSRYTGHNDNGDRVYEYINGNRDAGAGSPVEYLLGWAIKNEGTREMLGINETPSYLEYMTADEIATYNYVYSSQGADGARAYLEYLKPQLTERQTGQVTDVARQIAGQNAVTGALASAGSVLVNSFAGVHAALGQAVTKLRGGELDPNASYNLLTNTKNAVRDEVSAMVEQNFGPAGSFFYGIGMSMADMLADAGTGSSGAAMALIGSRSFSESVIDAKNRGLSDGEAMKLGAASAAAELLTERIGVDELLHVPKEWGDAGFWKRALKGAVGEAGEEGVTNLVNLVADISIAGEKSEFSQSVEQYKREGMSEKEAFGQALKDAGISLGLDALGGAVSGGVFGGLDRSGKNAAAQRKSDEALEGGAANVQQTAENAAPVKEPSLREAARRENNPLISHVAPTPESRDKDARMAEAATNAQVTGILYDVADEKIREAERIGELIGKQVFFYAENPTEYGIQHGVYDRSEDSVGINTKSRNLMAATIGHELTHSVEIADSYGKLKDVVLSRITAAGGDLETMRQQKQALYVRNGVRLETEEIDREIVANYVEEHLLTDEQSIRQLVRDDRSVARRILDWLDGLWAKLSRTKGSQERAFVRQAREIYRRALAEADAKRTRKGMSEAMTDAYASGDDEAGDAILEAMYGDDPAGMLETDWSGYDEEDYDFSFGGVNANGADMEALERAKRMKEGGADAGTILKETGWYVGADGKWRFEIEARDVSAHRGMAAEERKNRLPNTGDESTVFVEGQTRQYSISENMTEAERYEELKNKTVAVVEDTRSADYGDDVRAIEALPSRAKSRVEKIIKPLAVKLGILNRTMRTPEVEIDFQFSTNKGLNESLNKQLRYGGRYVDFAKALIHLDEVLGNAVLIERHGDKYKGTVRENRNLKMTHVLMGAFENEDGIIPIQMEIKETADTVGKLYMTVAMTKIEAGVMGSTIGVSQARSLLPTSNYRIADIFAEINPKDAHFLKYVPDGFLNREQSAAKREALAEDARRISGYAKKQYSIGENDGTYTEDEGAEIEELRNRADMENAESGGDTAWTALEPGELKGKIKAHYDRTLRALANQVARALDVPSHARREFLKPIAEELAVEYLRNGTVPQALRDRLFETAWDQGRVVGAEFYDTYKEVKDYLRTTAVTISEADRDSRDYPEFRKLAFGTLKLVNEGGLPVDTMWGQLQEMAPALFPDDILNPADQLQHMYEVGRSIQKVERTLNEYYGSDAEIMKRASRNDFDAAVQAALIDLWRVYRAASEEKAEAAAVTAEDGEELTAEQVTALYPKLKQTRRDMEKAVAKNLLTKRDREQVQRLLRHDIQLEQLDPMWENVEGIRAVYEAKRAFEEAAEPIRRWNRQRKARNYAQAEMLIDGAGEIRDKKRGILYSRETMERNIRDIVKDRAAAERIVATYFKPVHDAAAAATRMKNEYRQRVRELDISRKVKKGDTVSEAYAVQFYGEVSDILRIMEDSKFRIKKRDGKTYQEWQAELQKLWDENPGLDKRQIEYAAWAMGNIYEELFSQMNEARIRNGYEPVNHRSGYFPHFQRDGRDGILAQFGKAMGIDVEVQQLPTTINGLTHTFKPGIRWFGNALERKGFNTAYDAVEGFDRYIEGVADVVHQTDNIQRLRALANQLRYRTSDEGLKEQIRKIQERTDLSDDEKDTLIREKTGEGKFELSNFVVELDEYTNLLANKKSRADRNMEQAMGRDMYNVVKAMETRVAANMVAINPGSWLTNFIPITQGWACLDTQNLIQGMLATVKAAKTDDGIVDRSSFLTGRQGSDPLIRTWAQNASATLSKPMEWIDNFTAGTLVRARYQQNLKLGLSENEAMSEADSWAADVMADRTKGATPTLFNRSNPLTKLFTQFQLEVNNQLSYVWKDIPREKRDKGKKALALALLKFALGAWAYNELYERLFGRRPALDPVDMLTGAVGDAMDPETDLYDTAANLGGKIAENTPFVGGLLGGGRVPISSALPDWGNLGKALLNDDWSVGKKAAAAAKELTKPAVYMLPPFGGGQLKKIYEGLKMISQGGSYTLDAKGNLLLQYPLQSSNSAVQSALEAGQAMIFGKTTIRSGREWVEGGFKNLSAEQTATYQALLALDVSQADAFALMQELRAAEKTDEQSRAQVQRDILRASGLESEALGIVYYDLMASSDNEIAMLDALREAGADMGIVASAVVDIKDAENSNRKREAIMESGLEDAHKQKLYHTMISESWDDEIQAFRDAGLDMNDFLTAQNAHADIKEQYEDEGDMATAFARWVNQQGYTSEQKEVVRDSLKYWQMMPASAGRYDKAIAAGLSDEEAYELSQDLNELEPPEGKSSVQDIQKWRVAVDNAWSTEQQLQMLQAAGMSGVAYEKVSAAWDVGIAPAAWVRAQELKPDFDSDGNGSLTNADWTKLIDTMCTFGTVLPGNTTSFHLTAEQKGFLWQMLTGTKSTKNNPYSKSGGEKWLAARGE